jgi:hypothetical protein
LATNSASKKQKYITASVEDCPIFKKIRNKLKFVGANKAVLETGKHQRNPTVPFVVEFCWSMNSKIKLRIRRQKKYNFIELQQRKKQNNTTDNP